MLPLEVTLQGFLADMADVTREKVRVEIVEELKQTVAELKATRLEEITDFMAAVDKLALLLKQTSYSNLLEKECHVTCVSALVAKHLADFDKCWWTSVESKVESFERRTSLALLCGQSLGELRLEGAGAVVDNSVGLAKLAGDAVSQVEALRMTSALSKKIQGVVFPAVSPTKVDWPSVSLLS